VSSSEIIIVRSLADSDMGLFSAHRKATTSKQRAIALTTRAVKELLHPDVLRSEGAEFDCISVFGLSTNREPRLGGRQIEGRDFADLDAKDFALIRSRRHNDGSAPILITFIGRRSHRWIQAGLAATLERLFHQSVAIFGEDAPDFQTLADLFPSVPARVAVRPPLQASLLPLN
jgi:hypothetical protein